jgi:uncharacterized membrane protein
MRDLEKRGVLGLDDALVIAKDDKGNVTRRRDPSHWVLLCAIGGGLLGVPFVFLLPVASVVFGVIVGALFGKLLVEQRVDEEWVLDAERTLRVGSAALLLRLRTGDVADLGAVLRSFPARIHETTLAPDMEATLRRAMQ